ncbi:hypothetical protein [Azospirillum argentinense]
MRTVLETELRFYTIPQADERASQKINARAGGVPGPREDILHSPLPSAHAQTSFALTRQADLWSAVSGERVARRAGEGVAPGGASGKSAPPSP